MAAGKEAAARYPASPPSRQARRRRRHAGRQRLRRWRPGGERPQRCDGCRTPGAGSGARRVAAAVRIEGGALLPLRPPRRLRACRRGPVPVTRLRLRVAKVGGAASAARCRRCAGGGMSATGDCGRDPALANHRDEEWAPVAPAYPVRRCAPPPPPRAAGSSLCWSPAMTKRRGSGQPIIGGRPRRGGRKIGGRPGSWGESELARGRLRRRRRRPIWHRRRMGTGGPQ